MNPVIQLAAALDRRGVTVSVNGDGDGLLIHRGGYRQYIPISRQVRMVAPSDIGKNWQWEYGGRSGTHPVDDHEGAAAAIEAFLRADKGLAGTALLRRMDKHAAGLNADARSAPASQAASASRARGRGDHDGR